MAPAQADCGIVIITGISPSNPLSTYTAVAFAKAGASKLALLGTDNQYLQAVTSDLTSQHPDLDVLPQTVDITSSESLGLASHHIRSQLGAWDVFVHNASGFVPTDVIEKGSHRTTIRGADDDIWWSFFERNVRGLHFIARHFFPKMTARPVFINILPVLPDEGHVAVGRSDGDSAENASGIAAAQIVEYLGEENRKTGLKAVNVVNRRPVDDRDDRWSRTAADFVVWSAEKRSALVSGMHLDSDLGAEGYAEVEGSLRLSSTEIDIDDR